MPGMATPTVKKWEEFMSATQRTTGSMLSVEATISATPLATGGNVYRCPAITGKTGMQAAVR